MTRAVSLVLFTAVLVTGTSYVATEGPCAGKDLTGAASTLLQGAHLKVMEMQWSPYAFLDETAPQGWAGYDIDLFDAVAEMLGFTYEIDEPAMLDGETYTEMLLRTVQDGDLWLSWWLRSNERMEGATLLSGHVDASPVLIAPPPTVKSEMPWDTFFLPFSYPLWACITLMIFASGLVDYLLEYGYGGTLPSSIYEYFGGVLWGGFQDPHTRLSAVFQILNALIVMILVAAYTANLASFLVNSNQPEIGFGSAQELVASSTKVCSVGSYASQDTLEAIYPEMRFDTEQGGYGGVGDGLMDGACEAAILPKVDFDTIMVDGAKCEVSVVGESLYFSAAGWVTNLDSTLCIQRPIEYALHKLQADGTIDQLFNLWLPKGACESAEEEDASDECSRRRLQEGGRKPKRRLKSSSAASEAGRRMRAGVRRRLAGSGGSGSTAAAAAGGADDELQTMGVENFSGVFMVWGYVVGFVLILKAGAFAFERHKMSTTRVGMADKGVKQRDAPPGSPRRDQIDPTIDSSKYPEGLDINNQSAMLRYLISEIGSLKAEQKD